MQSLLILLLGFALVFSGKNSLSSLEGGIVLFAAIFVFTYVSMWVSFLILFY